jgi:hypothetical protein
MENIQLPKSAKQLSHLLLDYSTNLILNGSPSNVNGISELVVQHARNDIDAPPLAKFLAGIGEGKGVLACHYYWQFRDMVQGFQIANNISSVEWETANWKGEQLRYPMICDQLVCMERDIALCSRYKDKVVAKFLNFCKSWNLPIFVKGEDGYQTESTTQAVLAEAKKHQWAWLGHSGDLHPVYSSETGEVLYWLSEYAISLCSGDTVDPMRDSVWFEARQELTV